MNKNIRHANGEPPPGLSPWWGLILTPVPPKVEIRRLSWRQRLLSWPWRPWRRTGTVKHDVIRRGCVLKMGNHLLVHPDDVEAIKAGIARQQDKHLNPNPERL